MKHNVGDTMYIGSSWSISNGSSDVAGGLATISSIEISERLGKDHPNGIFVKFTELPGHSYNYKSLLEKQEQLKKQYEGKIAHPDPDEDRPWIENGDYVDGKIYKGPPIW